MTGCGCSGTNCRIDEYDPRHGTDNGYKCHNCRCHKCRRGHRQGNNPETKARRIARGIPDYMHGTANCYINYNCRQPKCYAAYSEYVKARRWKRVSV